MRVRWMTLMAVAALSAGCAGKHHAVELPGYEAGATGGSWKHLESGIASWYGGRWHGRKTASGERYDQNSMTAAHKRLPFNTRVRVTNLGTGQSCVVRINNRGPHVRGRVIDLSRAAADRIGVRSKGLARVKLEVAR